MPAVNVNPPPVGATIGPGWGALFAITAAFSVGDHVNANIVSPLGSWTLCHTPAATVGVAGPSFSFAANFTEGSFPNYGWQYGAAVTVQVVCTHAGGGIFDLTSLPGYVWDPTAQLVRLAGAGNPAALAAILAAVQRVFP